MIPNNFEEFGKDWADAHFTDPIVMGHSFGGTTALSIGEIETKVKAVIALDPWFYPRIKDDFKLHD